MLKSKPIQLLVGHCDTVWPIGTIENQPIRFEDAKIRGPGIFDMKAGLTQILFSLACLKKLNISASRSSTKTIFCLIWGAF